MRITTLLAAISALLFCSTVQAAEKLEYTRQSPTVQTRIFDRAKMPNPPPPITPPEAACCVADYQCNVELEYSVEQEGPLGIGGRGQVHITAVHATVTCAIVIWLPKGNDANLKAHEEGHRVIVERIYGKIDDPLRKILASYVGRTYDLRGGEGDAEAAKLATQAGNDASKACIKRIGDEAGRISDIYDQLTNHSMKKDPPPAKAIEQAFEQYGKEIDKSGK